jgi:diadenosine tetraphosphate (Ap4A) HIT family hydrolase
LKNPATEGKGRRGPIRGERDYIMVTENLMGERVADCAFCSPNIKERVLQEGAHVVAIADAYPVAKGHTLVVPKRHVSGYFDLTDAERRDADNLLGSLLKRMSREDPTITGYNIGINCGRSAGQTIFHVHYHLIPRRDGDTENPRGGVRGVIPGKRSY